MPQGPSSTQRRSRAHSGLLFVPPRGRQPTPRSVPGPGAPSPGSEASSWVQIGAGEAQSRSTHRGHPQYNSSSLHSYEALSSAGDSDPYDSIYATDDGVESPDWTAHAKDSPELFSNADMIAELNQMMSRESATVGDTSSMDAEGDEEVEEIDRLPVLFLQGSNLEVEELQMEIDFLSRTPDPSQTPDKAKNASSPAFSVNNFTTRGVTYDPVLGFCPRPDVNTLPLPRTPEEWAKVALDSHGHAWCSPSRGRSLASATGS